jgi:hypothetical protein
MTGDRARTGDGKLFTWVDRNVEISRRGMNGRIGIWPGGTEAHRIEPMPRHWLLSKSPCRFGALNDGGASSA